MNDSQELFQHLAASLPDAREGKMFGARALLAPNGKAAVLFKEGEMAFKLGEGDLAEALALEGSTLFDPSGKGRPMKGWAQVASRHAARYEDFARRALAFVATLR